MRSCGFGLRESDELDLPSLVASIDLSLPTLDDEVIENALLSLYAFAVYDESLNNKNEYQ